MINYMKRFLTISILWLSAIVAAMAQATGPVWSVDEDQYEEICEVYYTLKVENFSSPEYDLPLIELGAFVDTPSGEECRGERNLRYIDGPDSDITHNKLIVCSHANEASTPFCIRARSSRTGYIYDVKLSTPLTLGQGTIGSETNPIEATISVSADEVGKFRSTQGVIWTCLYSKYEKDVQGYFQLDLPDDFLEDNEPTFDVGVFLPSSETGQSVTCHGLIRGVQAYAKGINSYKTFNDPKFSMRIWTDDDLTGATFRLYSWMKHQIFKLAPTSPINAKAGILGSPKEPVILKIVDEDPADIITAFYTASFYDDAKHLIYNNDVARGAAITAPEPPAKVGHHFTGWQPEVPEAMPAHNMTFRATYAPNLYTVTFVGDGGNVLASYQLPYGSVITDVPDAKVAGKIFTGWNDPTFRKGETIVTADVTYTAQYRTDVYQLSFVIDGEEYMSTGLAYGAIIELPQPQREGYTFQGWEGLPAGGRMPASALVLTGHFEVNRHVLRFLLADGTELSRATVAYGAEIVAPKVDVVGYTFTGWEEPLAATMPDCDVTYTARPLTPINYHLRYMVSDAATPDELTLFLDVSFHYGDRLGADAILANLVIEGYDHTTWDWGTFSPATMTMPAEDVTVTCRRTIHRHNVSFVDGAETISTVAYDYGATIEHPADPQKEGYTFTGWEPQVDATMPDHDVTYKAQYAVNEHYVSFADYNGRVITTRLMPYGAAIVVPAEAAEATAARKGYDFTGWLVAGSTTPVKDVDATVPDQNITLTATYAEHKYTVQFVDTKGDVIVTYKMSYGAVINTNPVAPEVAGKTFAGWMPDFVPGHTTITADQTFTAVYKANPHAINYTIDGEVFYTQWLVEGESIVAPEAPQRTGYTFKGWSGLPTTMPASDVTVTGAYTVNRHVVTFNVEGQTPQKFTYNYGASIVAPIPEREGYTFTGWNVVVEPTMPDYDLEYTAVFTKNQYTVIFYDAPQPGADQTATPILNRQILTMGDAIERPADPTRKGYIFTGWTPSFTEGTLMTTCDMSYAANYSPRLFKLTYLLDGKVYAECEYLYGRPLTCMPDVVEKGKTFSGWTYTPGAAYADEAHTFPATMPDHDVIIEGHLYDKTDVFGTDEGMLYAVKDDAEDAVELVGFDDDDTTAQRNVRGHRAARRAAAGETLVLPARVTDADGREYTLTTIAPGAFQRADISAITIPATVVTIGEGSLDSESLQNIRFEGAAMPELRAGAFDPERVNVTADAVAEADRTQAINALKDSNEALAQQIEKANENDRGKVAQMFTIAASVDGRPDVMVQGTGTYNYGSTIVLTIPEQEGYAVSYKIGNAETVWSNSCILMADEDVSVVFSYSPMTYNVIYVIEGETIRTIPTSYGAALSTSGVKAEERTGYTFQGWSAVPATMPAHNVTVTGAYKVNEYVFTVIVDGVETARQTVPYGAALNLPEISKEGYRVIWPSDALTTMPARDYTLIGCYVTNEEAGVHLPLCDGDISVVYNLRGQRVTTVGGTKGIIVVGGRKKVVK